MAENFDFSEYGSEDDLNGYDYPAEGQYHLVIHEVDDTREKSNAVYVGFTVLDGTTPGQVNKQFRERFADPDPSHKDGGKFARKRQAKLLLSAGVIDPSAFGSTVQIDWQSLLYRQIKACVENFDRETRDGKRARGAELDGMNFYGPLDPAAAHIPHDQDAIQMAFDAGQINVVKAMSGGTPEVPPAPAAAPGHAPAAKQLSVREQMAAKRSSNAAATGASPAASKPAADPYAGL